ncbi:MAG: hypothetical protein K2J98_00915, partial [Malacoplasma sp.]|nr:hypothetical protein [Malacoplasma sp.]
NVNVSYVENSATKDSFEIKVVPVGNAIWKDTNNNEQKTIKVIMGDGIAAIPDATIPIKVSNKVVFPEPIKYENVNSSNAKSDINKWFVNYFKNYKISDFKSVGVGSDYKFANVDLQYVDNSVDLANKTFEMKATPKAGHSWSGIAFYTNSATETRTVKVSFDILNEQNTVRLESGYSVNWIINSAFDMGMWYYYYTVKPGSQYVAWPPQFLNWENISWFLTPGFDWHKQNYSYETRQWWKDLSVEYQKTMFEEGVKDLERYYPVKSAGDFSTVKWGNVKRIYQGVSFNFSVLVKPAEGHYWEDGKTDARYRDIKILCSSKADVKDGVVGSTYDFNDIKKLNSSIPSDNIPDVWVTNGLLSVDSTLTAGSFDQNQKIIYNIVKAELEKAFPQYNIEVTDIFSATPKYPYNYYGTWKYRILFSSKENPSYLKTINGFYFSE